LSPLQGISPGRPRRDQPGVRQLSGISLDQGKMYMIGSCFGQLRKEFGCSTLPVTVPEDLLKSALGLPNLLREMWKVFRPFLLVLALIVVAPLGYVVLEGWSFPEAFYMGLITITTVGFGEVKPLSEAGRFFTSGLIIFGIGTFTYALSTTTSKIVEGRLNEEWKRKKMMKRVERMKDHYIICGVGSTGKWVIREFLKAKRPFVVIEHRHHHLMELLEEFPQLLWIEGDATEEEVLLRAGIKRAKGLLALLSTDADNLFLIITSKGLNPNLHIISRANDEKSIDKLLQGGADRVVSPAMTEGIRIASLALRPDVMSFLDVVVYEEKDLLVLEEISIPAGSGWIGQFIGDMDISRKAEALLLGIKLREKERIVFNPSRMTLIDEGDKLILLGTEKQLERARQLILQGP